MRPKKGRETENEAKEKYLNIGCVTKSGFKADKDRENS